MTYQCGLHPGADSRVKRFVCDGCGLIYNLREGRLPGKWFFDGKAPPGWKRKGESLPREDFCGTCVKRGAAKPLDGGERSG
jgi:hypothetical protein